MMGGSRGLFGFMKPTLAPEQDITDRPAAPPASAFVYGQGGARLTPDILADKYKVARSLQAAGMDTSPVGSWAQGAARVAQALLGTKQMGEVEKASAQNMAESDAALQGLGGTGDGPSIAAILGNPYVNDGVKQAAKLQWQATHRAPVQPTEFERTVLAAGYQPGTPEYVDVMRKFVENKANPLQAVPGVDDQGNQVLRFIRPSGMKGGDPASGVPAGAAPPATLPPDFDFGDGGPTQPASGGFR